jgi:uncharacterized protein (TIGR03066 family)
MKKGLVLMMLAVVFVMASCSKESKLNRKLDGKWNLTKVDGNALPSGYTSSITFTKDKKVGTYSASFTFAGLSGTDTGTYTLEGDTKITMTSNATGSTATTSTITEYSKTTLIITDADGDTAEYTKAD